MTYWGLRRTSYVGATICKVTEAPPEVYDVIPLLRWHRHPAIQRLRRAPASFDMILLYYRNLAIKINTGTFTAYMLSRRVAYKAHTLSKPFPSVT
jgi:hypothetical protein